MLRSIGLALVLAPTALVAQCIPAPGTAVTLGQDTISAPLAIGFAFPIYGTTYTHISISDHGICFFSNAGVPAAPVATPLVYTPLAASLVANGPVVCPFWSDTIPGAVGAFFIDAQATQCTISWVNVQSFGFALPLMTFQMRLYDNGQLEFVYSPKVTNNSTYQNPANNGVVGISPGSPAVLPAASDLSTSLSTVDPTVFQHFLTANSFDMGGNSLLFVPTNPGWAVTHTRNGSGCAYVAAYGVGCDGLELTSTDPVLGTTWRLTTTGLNVVSTVGFTLFAFGRANPSLTLATFGVNSPGCWVHLPPTMIITRLIAGNVNGSMTVTVVMPAVAPWLIGESWTNQTFAFTNTNQSGIASSNAVHCFMGN